MTTKRGPGSGASPGARHRRRDRAAGRAEDGALAIAIFAKAPVAGRVKTRLVPPLSLEEAAEVARASLTHTIRTFVPEIPARWRLYLDGEPEAALLELARALDVPIMKQAEGDLGARLRAAFRDLRAEGATRTLAIGSDSPTLAPRWIREADTALREHDVVLGPAEDGGYYLIGIGRPLDALFEGIPWGSDRVGRETLERARGAGLHVRLLPVWYDLDDAAALRRAAADLDSAERAARGGASEGSPLRRTLERFRDRLVAGGEVTESA